MGPLYSTPVAGEQVNLMPMALLWDDSAHPVQAVQPCLMLAALWWAG